MRLTVEGKLITNKETIHDMVKGMFSEEHDMHAITPEVLDYQLSFTPGEIAASYAILGDLTKKERSLEAAVKRAEAQAYERARKAPREEGEKAPSVDCLKRQSLLDKDLIEIQERLGDAICDKIIQEGIIESLKTKREILKTLSIRQTNKHNMELN